MGPLMTGVFPVVPIVALLVLYGIQRLQTSERLMAIEKGVAVSQRHPDPWHAAVRLRTNGIIMIAIGLGVLLLLICIMGLRDGWRFGVGIGAILFLIGVGLLVDYFLRISELDSRSPARSPGSTTP